MPFYELLEDEEWRALPVGPGFPAPPAVNNDGSGSQAEGGLHQNVVDPAILSEQENPLGQPAVTALTSNGNVTGSRIPLPTYTSNVNITGSHIRLPTYASPYAGDQFNGGNNGYIPLPTHTSPYTGAQFNGGHDSWQFTGYADDHYPILGDTQNGGYGHGPIRPTYPYPQQSFFTSATTPYTPFHHPIGDAFAYPPHAPRFPHTPTFPHAPPFPPTIPTTPTILAGPPLFAAPGTLTAPLEAAIKRHLQTLASECSISNRTYDTIGDLPCTFACGKLFCGEKSKTRHEFNRFPPVLHFCYRCSGANTPNENFLFTREDSFCGHAHRKHGIPTRTPEMRRFVQESRIENTVITTRCGLCQQDIVFHELCEHVRRHVADGEDMDDWDDGLDD